MTNILVFVDELDTGKDNKNFTIMSNPTLKLEVSSSTPKVITPSFACP